MSANRGFNVKLYTELYKRCPKEQLRLLRKVETKHRNYIDKINSLPAELPKLDFETYKSKVRPQYLEMVNEFESKYNDFKVPVPTETATEEIEKEKEQVQEMVNAYIEERNNSIEELKSKIEDIKQSIPYEQMTWEEYIEHFPDTAPDFIGKPTFWPHLPDEQNVGPPKDH